MAPAAKIRCQKRKNAHKFCRIQSAEKAPPPRMWEHTVGEGLTHEKNMVLRVNEWVLAVGRFIVPLEK